MTPDDITAIRKAVNALEHALGKHAKHCCDTAECWCSWAWADLDAAKATLAKNDHEPVA